MMVSMAPAPISKSVIWTGRIVSALPVLFLVVSGLMKLLRPAPVVQGFVKYGYPESLIVWLGIIEIACTVIYLVPRTSVLGAILLTGYLGGATASNVRIGDRSFVVTLLLGVLVWAGLFLRDDKVRALIPLRR